MHLLFDCINFYYLIIMDYRLSALLFQQENLYFDYLSDYRTYSIIIPSYYFYLYLKKDIVSMNSFTLLNINMDWIFSMIYLFITNCKRITDRFCHWNNITTKIDNEYFVLKIKFKHQRQTLPQITFEFKKNLNFLNHIN